MSANWKTFLLLVGLWWLFKGRKPDPEMISQDYTEAPREVERDGLE